jgi:hypothetical protein
VSWDSLTEAEREKRLASWERLSGMFPLPNPWQRRGTDAGIALFDYATADDRYGDLADWIDKARAAVDQNGRWEHEFEVRMSTYATQRIERIATGFQAATTDNGRFRADFEKFGDAWEGVQVLSELGRSLEFALGWTTKPSTPDLEPEPDREIGEAYLKRLAREAPTHVPSKGASISTAPPPSEWEEPLDHIYVVTVRRESLVLECDCMTRERADLFLGVFDALADDLLEILTWKPLAAAG